MDLLQPAPATLTLLDSVCSQARSGAECRPAAVFEWAERHSASAPWPTTNISSNWTLSNQDLGRVRAGPVECVFHRAGRGLKKGFFRRGFAPPDLPPERLPLTLPLGQQRIVAEVIQNLSAGFFIVESEVDNLILVFLCAVLHLNRHTGSTPVV